MENHSFNYAKSKRQTELTTLTIRGQTKQKIQSSIMNRTQNTKDNNFYTTFPTQRSKSTDLAHQVLPT